jgi:transposase
MPWRDLPARFGNWNPIARRFRRWALAGVWEALFRAVQEPDYEGALVDSTTGKAHKAAAGHKKVRPAPSVSAAVVGALARESTPAHWLAALDWMR